MFELLRKLGSHLREIEGTSELQQLADHIGDDYHYGLAICFDRKGAYHGIRLTEGTDNILYKFGSPRGNDYTLVSRTSGNTENVVPRLRRNAEKILEWAQAHKKNAESLSWCHNSAEAQEETIQHDLVDTYPDDADASKRVFAYWAILDGDSPTGFYETPVVREYLEAQALEDYALRSSTKKRMAGQGTCAVCGTSDSDVYGNFSEIATYNIDKPGFIAGGFDYAQTVNNLPVCTTCILDLLGGKTYAENNLDFYLGGLRYWALPDSTDPDAYRFLLDDLVRTENRQTLGHGSKNIAASEYDIHGIVANRAEDGKTQDPVTLSLFFYESSQASWRIISEVRRILPSRISNLYDAKEAIEGMVELQLSKRDRENGFTFDLRTVRPFTDHPRNSEINREFLRYIEALFNAEELNRHRVLRGICRSILDAHKDAAREGAPWPVFYRTRDAWATYQFLLMTDTISKEETMTQPLQGTDGYTSFMNEHPEFFGRPERRAAFLTGCYVGSVLYAQRKARGSEPFVKKFLGQKLDKDRLMRLYNEGKEKLVHYEGGGLVHKLEPLIAETWVDAQPNWALDDEETTFAFNLGWTLNQKLATDNRSMEDGQ